MTTEIKKYVILATPRTGSTFLRMYLNCHSRIISHGEVFLPHYPSPDGFLYFLKSHNYLMARIYNSTIIHKISRRLTKGYLLGLLFSSFLNKYMTSLFCSSEHNKPFNSFDDALKLQPVSTLNRIDWIGFKLMFGQMKANRFIEDFLQKEKPAIIYLYRNNIYDVAISRLMMYKTGTAQTEKDYQHPKLKLNKREVLKEIQKEETIQELCRRFLLPFDHFCISYEEFFADDNAKKLELLNFLGYSNLHNADVPLRKITKKSSEGVTNHVEIKDYLIENGYKKFFENEKEL